MNLNPLTGFVSRLGMIFALAAVGGVVAVLNHKLWTFIRPKLE